MSETTQLVAVGVIVAGAVLLLLRSAWKTLMSRSAKHCGSGCSSCSMPVAEAKDDGRFPLKQL